MEELPSRALRRRGPGGHGGQVLRSATSQREFELSGVTIEAGGLQHAGSAPHQGVKTFDLRFLRGPLPAEQ